MQNQTCNMDKIKDAILSVLEAYNNVPLCTLAKNEKAHRSILLGIEHASGIFDKHTQDLIEYHVHGILTEIGIAEAENAAYKDQDPPEWYYEECDTIDEFIPSKEDLKKFSEACKQEEDSLPF